MKPLYEKMYVIRNQIVVHLAFWKDETVQIRLQQGILVILQEEDLAQIQEWIKEERRFLESFDEIEDFEQEIQDFMNDLPDYMP